MQVRSFQGYSSFKQEPNCDSPVYLTNFEIDKKHQSYYPHLRSSYSSYTCVTDDDKLKIYIINHGFHTKFHKDSSSGSKCT
jgi:hypothetical protein